MAAQTVDRKLAGPEPHAAYGTFHAPCQSAIVDQRIPDTLDPTDRSRVSRRISIHPPGGRNLKKKKNTNAGIRNFSAAVSALS
jgi:hypothetical protein